MATPTGFVTSQDGSTIAYDRVGTGPALILVSGATQYRRIDPGATKFIELLAADFTVYHYDRRGRGDSSDCSNPASYTVAREVEDIAALIERAGGSTYLFGMSSGAVLSLNAAAAGLPIQRMALYEPPFTADPNGSLAEQETWVRSLKELYAEDRRSDMVAYFMGDIVGMPAEAVTAMQNNPFWAQAEAIAPTLIYDTIILLETQRNKPLTPDQWANVTVPTLVLDGGDSPDFMRDAVQLVVDALPNAQRHTLAGQTHSYDPALLAPVLKEFYTGR